MSVDLLDVCVDQGELERWGEAVGRIAAREGVVVALTGPLGAGKTTLVRAAGRGAGAADLPRSPTYTLHHVHRLIGGGRLHHLDLYRVRAETELEGLGWDELLASGGAVFIEWADRAGRWLPADRWDLDLAPAEGGARRRVRALRVGRAPELPPLAALRETPC
jgi:tRNA threonylcarbamoyladenosine biosynthesis protein TsaE